MKSKTQVIFAGLLFVTALGARALVAQEPQVFTLPVHPPLDGGEDILMYWNDMDDEGGGEVEWVGPGPEMEWFGTGPAMAATPMPHFAAGNRVYMRGENRPWLGVVLTDLDAASAKESKAASENGVLVENVREGSPAAKAGMMKDDVITEFAGEKVRSAEQLRRLVRETPTGRSVAIVVDRAGKTQKLTAQLEARHRGPMASAGSYMPQRKFTMRLPGPQPGEAPKFDVFIPRGARLGISGDDLTPQLAEFFGVKQGKGVLVREVTVASAAEKAGLKAGDVITAVDGTAISSVGKLRRALAGDPDDAEKRKVTLTIVRDKREQSLVVELDAADKGMPRPAMRTGIGIDAERIREIAAEKAARAKGAAISLRARANEYQNLLQGRLQEELKRLEKELPKLQEEIQKKARDARTEIEWI